MATNKEHLQLIKVKGKFTVDCNLTVFSTGEIEILEKYGHSFIAIITGQLEPITDLQKNLIMVSRSQRSPSTIEELAWFKYLSRKVIETKSGSKLYEQHHLQDDTFYSRDMVKKQKSMMFGEMKKNHKL